MDVYDSIVRSVAFVGVPAAALGLILLGLHWWMSRAWTDIVQPVGLEAIKLLRCTRRRMGQATKALESLAESMDRLGRRHETE